MPERTPDIAVAVASHGRPLRLRWLLNALEGQTLARDRWEVVVCHTDEPATTRVVAEHPLAADGTLRSIAVPAADGRPSMQRNLAWRASSAPVVLFTDDDCRPPEDWLEDAVRACGEHPGAVVQGPTLSDPDEQSSLSAPLYHSQHIPDPPTPWAQTCNIAYPRELLKRLGGFDESFPAPASEDTDLALRAKAAGAEQVGDDGMLTYHAVLEMPLWDYARSMRRFASAAELVKRHPELRAELPARYFYRWTHVWLPLALLGALVGIRRPLLGVALALPWAHATMPGRGLDPRGLVRSGLELPGRAVIDVSEFVAFARASARARSLLL